MTTVPRVITSRMGLGLRLRSHRVGRGRSQQDAATTAGVSQNAMSRYERGERSISLEATQRLAEEYGISIDELVNTEHGS